MTPHTVFELHTKHDCSVRVHFTSTGDKVYGAVPEGKGQNKIFFDDHKNVVVFVFRYEAISRCTEDDSSLSLVGGAHGPPEEVKNIFKNNIVFCFVSVLITWHVRPPVYFYFKYIFMVTIT